MGETRSAKVKTRGKPTTVPVRGEIEKIPPMLTGDAYYKVGQYDFNVGEVGADAKRAKLRDRVFHAYLELFFQAKHDDKIDNYCKRNKIECKKEKGTRVVRAKGDDTDFGVYDDLGRVACEVVRDHMEQVWSENTGGGAFVRDAQKHLAVQGVKQSNGYHYDVSFYYCGKDIFVHFHCYPSR